MNGRAVRDSIRIIILWTCLLAFVGSIVATVASALADDQRLVVSVVAVPETEVIVDDRAIVSIGVIRAGTRLDEHPGVCGSSRRPDVEAGGARLVRDIVLLRIDNEPACIEFSRSRTFGDIRLSVTSIDRARPGEERPVHTVRIYAVLSVLDRLRDNIAVHVAGFSGGVLASWLLIVITQPRRAPSA